MEKVRFTIGIFGYKIDIVTKENVYILNKEQRHNLFLRLRQEGHQPSS
jgi:hypothetical protein